MEETKFLKTRHKMLFQDRPNDVSKILRVAPLKGEQLYGADEAAASCDTRLNKEHADYKKKRPQLGAV